jgi:membrane-associated protease RseP (regulator of RpoE activity)
VPFEPAAEAAASPTWRIGIGPYGSPVVAKVRGETRHLLESGDRLLRAEGPGGAISLQGAEDLATLPFHGPIERLVVRRGDDEVVLPVSLATPAAIYAFGEDIDLENPKGTAVEPIPAGTTSPMGGSFGRYPGSPAADAGIRPGERLVRVGGSAVNSWTDILDAVHEHAGPDPLPLVVRGADGEERDVVVHPVALVPLAEGRLSLEEVMEPFETEGVLDAAGVAIRRTGGEIVGIFRVIGAFFTGNLSFQKNVAGPVTIVRASAARSEQGILSFFLFLAYISVTLAVMNVLPIPVLDGGHLMFILIEKVKGSPLKEETMGKLQTVGLMLLLVLMFFAFRNDILSLMH